MLLADTDGLPDGRSGSGLRADLPESVEAVDQYCDVDTVEARIAEIERSPAAGVAEAWAATAIADADQRDMQTTE